MGQPNDTIKPAVGQVAVKKADETDKETIEKEKEVVAKREEQERTTIKKKLFLEVFEKSLCMIAISCEKAGINRNAYYDWMKSDPEFHKTINEIKSRENESVENKLKKLIMQEKQGSIHFYLEKRHPDYKPKSSMELSPSSGGPTCLK